MCWLRLGSSPHAVRTILAGWVPDLRSQRRHQAPEECSEVGPDAGLRPGRSGADCTQTLETRRREALVTLGETEATDGGAWSGHLGEVTRKGFWWGEDCLLFRG